MLRGLQRPFEPLLPQCLMAFLSAQTLALAWRVGGHDSDASAI